MTRSKRKTALTPAAALFIGAGLLLSGQTLSKANRPPRLAFVPPAELYHSALRPPEIYESNQTNASVQVYVFRQAPIDIQARFQRSLLREWIAPGYQEGQLSRPPSIQAGRIPGADATLFAQFAEPLYGGMVRPRLRVLILSNGSAAILDAQAQSPQAWSIFAPSLQALMATLRVEAGPEASPMSPTPASRALAGLYGGVKPKFVSTIGPGVGAGSGGFVRARHFYLFSDDGRVYRAFDEIAIPGGDPRNFDFNQAMAADPVNSGQYSIAGNQLTLRMGERLDEVATVDLNPRGSLTIGTVEYSRLH